MSSEQIERRDSMQTVFQKIAHRYWLAALLVLIGGAAIAFLSASNATSASSSAAPQYFLCTPVAVATFSDRVHVRCSPAAPGGIAFFAVCSTSDAANAARFLSVFTTAKVTGKQLAIYYNPNDTSGTSCGCASADCRLATGAEVQQ
jgi:hypothetical protein